MVTLWEHAIRFPLLLLLLALEISLNLGVQAKIRRPEANACNPSHKASYLNYHIPWICSDLDSITGAKRARIAHWPS